MLPIEIRITGRTYEGDGTALSSMRWAFSGDGCDLAFSLNGEEVQIAAGRNAWKSGGWEYAFDRKQAVAAWGSWTEPNTYTVCLQYLEEPGSTVFAAVFENDRVSVTTQMRGRFVDPDGPSFEGVAN